MWEAREFSECIMHLSPHHHLLLTSYYFLFVCLSVLLFVCSFVHNSIDVNSLHLLNYHAH